MSTVLGKNINFKSRREILFNIVEYLNDNYTVEWLLTELTKAMSTQELYEIIDYIVLMNDIDIPDEIIEVKA